MDITVRKIFCFALIFITAYSGFALNIKKENKDNDTVSLQSLNTIRPVIWAKPLEGGTIKILAIAPYFCSMDFIELEKRLDCSVELITTEDSIHLGCDPFWGKWCSEEHKADAILRKIKDIIKEKWDVIIIAGIKLDILPKDIYETIINKTAEGTGLLLIPPTLEEPSPPHFIEDFIHNLDVAPHPIERWGNLFSGGNPEIQTKNNYIVLKCSEYEKGRIVYIQNYLNGVLNHALLPEQAVTGEMTYLENAWSGVISLILWCSHLSDTCQIKNILDAKPAGPIEEEIPPELPMMVIRNLNQSLLGPGTYPFYIEIQRKGKQKIDEIRMQIRRENDYFFYQLYEFKPKLQKEGDTFTQIELPVGAGNYFLDVWILQKGKVLDFFSKRFTFASWPTILSVEPNKKYVFPNDSITLKVNISPNLVENSEGTIIVQGIDNYPVIPLTDGNLVSEQCQRITGKESEVHVTLHFADLVGSYLKINIWGAPTQINHLGSNYSPLFSYYSIYIPIRRKIFEQGWKDFVQWDNIREYNQLQTVHFFMNYLNCGNYLPIKQYESPLITKLYQPSIVQMTEECTTKAVNKNIRKPCINDEQYLNKTKEDLAQIAGNYIIPTPYAVSLGLNNCLVQTEEFVCLCDQCIHKFIQTLQLGDYWNEIPGLVDTLNSLQSEISQPETLEKIPPTYLSLYSKFMDDSFNNFEVDIKNKLKMVFPEIPIGFKYYYYNEHAKNIDWLETIHSMDWVVLPPEPFALSFAPYIKSQKKSFWIWFDFADPSQTVENIAWNYWNAILNQANGVWFLHVNGDSNHSIPIKTFTENGKTTPVINSLLNINEKLKGGLKDLFSYLQPDYNEEIGIYYSPENLYLTSAYPELSHKNSFTHFLRLLHGFGINPITVTKENLLTKDKLKLLIFPCCIWLSEEEIEKVTDFLEKGVIIADIPPGCIDSSELAGDLRNILNMQNNRDVRIKNKNLYLMGKSLAGDLELQSIDDIKNEISFIREIFKTNEIHSPFLNDSDWIDGRFYSFNNCQLLAWQPQLKPIPITKEVSLNPSFFRGSHVRNLTEQKTIKDKKIRLKTEEKIPVILFNQTKEDYTLDMIVPETIQSGNRIPVKIVVSKIKNSDNIDLWVYIELNMENNKNKPLYSNIVHIKGTNTTELFIPIPQRQIKGWYIIKIRDFSSGIEKKKFIKIK